MTYKFTLEKFELYSNTYAIEIIWTLLILAVFLYESPRTNHVCTYSIYCAIELKNLQPGVWTLAKQLVKFNALFIAPHHKTILGNSVRSNMHCEKRFTRFYRLGSQIPTVGTLIVICLLRMLYHFIKSGYQSTYLGY